MSHSIHSLRSATDRCHVLCPDYHRPGCCSLTSSGELTSRVSSRIDTVGVSLTAGGPISPTSPDCSRCADDDACVCWLCLQGLHEAQVNSGQCSAAGDRELMQGVGMRSICALGWMRVGRTCPRAAQAPGAADLLAQVVCWLCAHCQAMPRPCMCGCRAFLNLTCQPASPSGLRFVQHGCSALGTSPDVSTLL